MAFNINFGQAVISNAQKDRQLDLEQQRINNQREAAAASAANQASATFWSRVNAEEANANRKKELELREEKQDQELSWDDAVKEQELAEKEARTENLKKLSAKYDAAFESDKAKAEEEVAQAKERQNLLNSELGTLYLSAYQRGGRVSPSQLQAFNAATGSQYDFIGNTMTIPMRDGTVKTETIGDGKSFFMGQFQRDAKGDIVYGQDGTPVTQMVEMPRQMQRALLSSAYGKDYMGTESKSGLSLADRLELEDAKAAGRMELEGLKQKGSAERTAANNAAKEKIVGMQTASRERIAEGNNATRMSIAEIGAALKAQGYEIDEKKLAEAIRHNQATEGTAAARQTETARHNQAQEGLRGRSIDERARHNGVTEEQGQVRLDETAAHNAATEELGQAKLEHNKNRLENDKEQKEADRQLRRELAQIGALARRNAGRSGSGQSDPVLKEIQQLQKTIDGGRLTPENRESMRKRINELAEQYGVQSDKGTIKPSDNSGDVEFKQLSREEFAELAKTDPEKARAYLAELKKRKSSK